MRIGFVGIGRMGEPMVLRLLKAGFQVTVWNRTREKLPSVVDAGATATQDLQDVSLNSDVVLTMVTDDAAVRQVYQSTDGLLSAAVQGKSFADMSTILPETVKHVAAAAAERGASFVDAPVAGTVQPAREGRLLVFVGGEQQDIERLRPVFAVLARRVQHLGPVGSGAAMKLVHNALLTTYWSVFAEAMAMGTRYGLNFKDMIEVIGESPAAFAALPVKVPALLGQPAEVGFNIANVQKDLRTITAFAESVRLPVPILRVVQNAFDEAASKGLAHEDVAAIVKQAVTND